MQCISTHNYAWLIISCFFIFLINYFIENQKLIFITLYHWTESNYSDKNNFTIWLSDDLFFMWYIQPLSTMFTKLQSIITRNGFYKIFIRKQSLYHRFGYFFAFLLLNLLIIKKNIFLSTIVKIALLCSAPTINLLQNIQILH